MQMFYSINISSRDISFYSSRIFLLPSSFSWFCRQSLAKLYRKHGNLVVTQSQTKLIHLYILRLLPVILDSRPDQRCSWRINTYIYIWMNYL